MQTMVLSKGLSQEPTPAWAAAFDYAAYWAKNPDPGSIFDQKTRGIRGLPAQDLVATLIQGGYDGIMLVDEAKVVGHVFFEKQVDTWHLFSIEVAKEKRHQGLGSVLLKDFLLHTWSSGVRQIRIGAGANQNTEGVWQHFLRTKISGMPFFILPQEGGWARLA